MRAHAVRACAQAATHPASPSPAHLRTQPLPLLLLHTGCNTPLHTGCNIPVATHLPPPPRRRLPTTSPHRSTATSVRTQRLGLSSSPAQKTLPPSTPHHTHTLLPHRGNAVLTAVVLHRAARVHAVAEHQRLLPPLGVRVQHLRRVEAGGAMRESAGWGWGSWGGHARSPRLVSLPQVPCGAHEWAPQEVLHS